MVHVRLLGDLEVEADGTRIDPPASRRAWSLLAWLALHPGEHPRSTVAAAFWPDVLDSSARASLRSAAWALRRALGPAADGALTGGRDRIGLTCETDLTRFDHAVACGDLEAAAACCRGPLLADLDEDWVFEARDEHAHRVSAVLARLADQADTPEAAVEYARRRLALDPLDEAAARDLMQRLAAAGDRAGALAAGERLRERLRAQLGIAVSPQTRALEAELRTEEPPPPVVAAPVPGPEPSGLIGRAAELAALDAAWQRAAAGEGLVVALEGEGGIGKTRLAGELLAHAAATGARTAICAAMELGGAAPLGLWAELLRNLAARIAPVPPGAHWPDELAALVPSLPARLGRAASALPAPVAPELQRARLSEAAVDALEHAAFDRPLALLFEDVHLADRQSLDLLTYVARRLAGAGVLIVVTRRHAPAQPALDGFLVAQRARDALVEVELQPLARAAIGDLVRQVATLDPDAHDQVVAAADGNPLLAVESARAAARGLEGPPPGLRAVVRAATGALPGDARRVAELAAVAGRELGRRELAAIAGAETVVRAMDSGLFVSADGHFGFRHALLREAVVAGLPDARARELHEELAGVIEGSAAETARHLRLAGHDGEAARRLSAAAGEAVAIGAVEQAADYLEEAIALAPADSALRLQYAEVQAWRGRREDADRLLSEALERAPQDPAARARAHVEAAKWYSGALCWPRRTLVHARAAVELLDALPEPDPEILPRALAFLVWGESNAGDLETGDTLLRRLDAMNCTDPTVRHEIENARGFRLLRGGDFEGALQTFVAMAASEDLGPDRAYTVWVNAACLAGGLGRNEEALEYADRGLQRVRGMPPLVADLQAVRATIFARMGRYDEARAAVVDERRAAERSGAAPLLVRAEYDEGMLCVGAGENDRAVELLYRSLEGGALVSRPAARLARAEALAKLDRPDDADAELRAVTLEPVGPADRPAVLVARLTYVQGLVAIARGDCELARRRLEESAASWRRITTIFDADDYLGNLVDLGRPSVGTVDPAFELARVEHELADLDTERAHADL
jgi:DNA-binding SARP family transcriptional activator/tetratricopeptide (TPR) repeat protein